MSRTTMKCLIGTALVDRDFCEDLLDGGRSQVLSGFDLTREEREVITSLEANSIQELAGQLHEWLRDREKPRPADRALSWPMPDRIPGV